MKELNRKTLKQALAELPQYEADPEIWRAISAGLDEDEEMQSLRALVADLPQYDPPALVWENIASELPQKKGVFALRPGRRLQIAAAVLLIFSLGTWQWWENQPRTRESLALSEEILPDIPEPNWEEDAAAFREVEQQLEQHSWLGEDPSVRDLQAELEELETAREEIKAMMSSYGKDPELIREMGQLERERGEIIKKLATII